MGIAGQHGLDLRGGGQVELRRPEAVLPRADENIVRGVVGEEVAERIHGVHEVLLGADVSGDDGCEAERELVHGFSLG